MYEPVVEDRRAQTLSAVGRWFLLGAALVAIFYARTLWFDLFGDDFHVLRPWHLADIRAALFGPYRPWDPAVAFYRPLTALYYAVAFNLFGLNAPALHLIPILAMAVIASLTGAFVQRETGSRGAAALATVLIVIHPTIATSVGPWIANQYHAFMLIALLLALLWWQQCRDRPATAWWPIAPLLVVAALFKEDGILLPIALVAMHAARMRVVGDLRQPPWRIVAAAGALVAALIAWRTLWLPEQLGYGLRTSSEMLANLTRAPRYVLLLQVGPAPWRYVAEAAKLVVLGAAIWALVTQRTSPAARLIVIGLALVAVVNLPLALVSSEGRWHLVGLGAVFITTGALMILRRPVLVGAIVTIFAVTAWERIGTFAPCSADSREQAKLAAGLPDLPVDMIEWLRRRDAMCDAHTFTPFDLPIDSLRWGRR